MNRLTRATPIFVLLLLAAFALGVDAQTDAMSPEFAVTLHAGVAGDARAGSNQDTSAADSAEAPSLEESTPVTVRNQRSQLPPSSAIVLLAGGVATLPMSFSVLRWALLLPLFSRLQTSDLLESQGRTRILELLRSQPGLGIKDICAELVIGWGTAVHHLSKLERAGLLVSQDSGRRRRFFLPGTSPTVRTALCVLSAEPSRRLLEHVRDHPGSTQTDVCNALGLSAPLVHKYAARLANQGLLETHRQWRTVRYFAAHSVTSHLEEYARLRASPTAEGPQVPMGIG